MVVTSARPARRSGPTLPPHSPLNESPKNHLTNPQSTTHPITNPQKPEAPLRPSQSSEGNRNDVFGQWLDFFAIINHYTGWA